MPKLGLIADVHCNARQLAVALERLDDCDEILCAGDLLYDFRWEPRVLGLLEARGARVIVGNHDLGLYQSALTGLVPMTDGLERVAQLPRHLELEVAGLRVVMHHGSPWDRPDEGLFHYVHPLDTAALQRAAAVSGADVLILGHTHVPMKVQIGRTTIVNPGSCGEPGRQRRVHTCATIDLPSREVVFHDLPQVGRTAHQGTSSGGGLAGPVVSRAR